MKSNSPNSKAEKIPKRWEIKKIGGVCHLVKEPYRPNLNENLPYIGLEHIEQGTLRLNSVGKSSDAISNKFKFKNGQILFGKLRPYFRKLYRPLFDGVCSTDIFVIDAENGNDNSFLFYFFANPKIIEEATRPAEGTKMPRASWNYLSNLNYPFPKFDEQKAIAKILSDLDSKIELNQHINLTLEETAQALFKHWFVDFEFPNEKGKSYKSSGGKMVWSEELQKEIPERWEVKKFGEYITVIKGCSYRSEDLKSSESALVTLKSINRGGGFNQDGFKEYVGEYKSDQILQDGEIVIAQTDLTQQAEVIGRPAIINPVGIYKKLIASLDLQIVRSETLPKSYIYYLLETEEFHNHALGYTNGTTVLHLNKNAVHEFIFVVPPKEILAKFERLVSFFTVKKMHSEQEMYCLAQIRDSLLPKLMSGQIRVGAS